MSILRANRLRSPKKLQNLQKVRKLRQKASGPWRRTRRRRRSAFESIQIDSAAPFEIFRWFNPFKCGSNRVPSDVVRSVMMGSCRSLARVRCYYTHNKAVGLSRYHNIGHSHQGQVPSKQRANRTVHLLGRQGIFSQSTPLHGIRTVKSAVCAPHERGPILLLRSA